MNRSGKLAIAAVLAFGSVIAGVSCVTSNAGTAGTACERASDCDNGLFCVNQTCTDDLSKLDGGKPSNFMDSGAETPADAKSEGGDASGETPPPVDTGPPPPDTGVTPKDTGTPPTDTGTPPVDTGPADTGVADTASADTTVADGD